MAEYERLEVGARTPWDAVVVNVREAIGRTVADVVAVEHVADFPKPVPRALEDAAELQKRMGLARIVVIVEDKSLWREQWGSLIEKASA